MGSARSAPFVPSLRETTVVATVTLGVDAVVGNTAADFIDAPPPRPGHALVVRRKTSEGPVIPPFARDMVSALEPARNRLLDEAARLDMVRRAALEYVDRPDEDRA